MRIARLVARMASLWRGVRHHADVDADMSAEFRHHLELRTEDLVRRGLPPAEAARVARVEFGHVGNYKADARAARGLGLLEQFRFSMLDVRLGVRMLRKYPGLSAVAVTGMSVAIAIGAGAFTILSAFADPSLPLPEGDRIIAIENILVAQPSRDRQTIQDFLRWRELESVRDLAAFRTEERNLSVTGHGTDLISLARMTASGFRVARAVPVRGRPLLDEDERPGAPPVLVIAWEEWQRRFDGDSGIVGRVVRLGSEVHTIVGVMPEGFRFPVSHRFWAPLRVDPSASAEGSDRSLVIFGRLADGVARSDVQAQVGLIGSRLAATYPESYGAMRPRVLPYTHALLGIDDAGGEWALRIAGTVLSLLLVVVAANVAILLYARTATRAGEIAVRTALGASRRRIVTQLFAEALVLSATAAFIGLGLTEVGLIKARQLILLHEGADALPFWVHFGLSRALVAYVVILAIVGAVITGVIPALKATGQHVQAALQRLSGHGSQLQLGRTWTALIVAQVALAVAVLPFGFNVAADLVAAGTIRANYPIDELLRASLSLEPGVMPLNADSADSRRAAETRFRAGVAELVRRLEGDPAVAGVAYASEFPGAVSNQRIEVEGRAGYAQASTNTVDPALFAVFELPILAGRGFVSSDAREGSTDVVVDQEFADDLLGGGPVLGRRIRYVERIGEGATARIETGPWLRVVGLVPALDEYRDAEEAPRMLYRAAAHDRLSGPTTLVVRSRTRPATAFASRLRQIAASVDPALQLRELGGAAERHQQKLSGARYMAIGMGATLAAVLLLSAAGIHAMMSFIVARRRREIGIRSALGAGRRRILLSVFKRASTQLGAGVITGLGGAVALDRAIWDGTFSGNAFVLLPAVALVIVSVGLAAAIGPARRGLSVQPTEALRAE